MAHFLHFCGFMCHRLRLFQLCSLLVFTGALGAQINTGASGGTGITSDDNFGDSVKPIVRSDPKWQYAEEISMGTDSFHTWDSAFIMVHRYNRAVRNAAPFTDLGTTASPQKLLYISQNINTGFYTGLNPYPLYNKTPDSFRFHKTSVPFSRFYYTQGGNGVFIFEALHTQNFSPGWNITVDFSSVQNGEIYDQSHQNNLHRALAAGSSYKSRNGKYYQSLIATWNRGRRDENRGISNDSAFFHDFQYSPSFLEKTNYHLRTKGNYIPVSQSASSVYTSRQHRLEQQYSLLEGGKLNIFHRLDWMREKYEYNEASNNFTHADSEFYGTATFYPGSFKDSSVWNQFNNSIGVVSVQNRLHWPLKFKFWYDFDYITYNSIYKTSKNRYFNQSVHAAFYSGNPFSKSNGYLKTAYWFSGHNSGNYLIEAGRNAKLTRNLKYGLKLKSQKAGPAFIATRFSSNYLSIYTNLKDISVNSIEGDFSWQNKVLSISLWASSGHFINYLFLDTSGNFRQTNLSFGNFKAEATMKLGKFYIRNSLFFQQQNHRSEIPFPNFSDLVGLYFQGPMFKKAMLARMGVDIWYMSSYTGYTYNPLNTMFIPGKSKVGNYPWVDLYISGEVKTVMFFIKTEHINASLVNVGYSDRYISALNYPGEPFRLRFGMIWRFYN